MVAYILKPEVFFGLLFGLFIISALIIFSFIRQEKRVSGELGEKEAAFKKEVKGLQDELTKLKGELSLNNQMYDGLKDQYSELEKNMERLVQQTQEENAPAQSLKKQESA